MIRAKFKKVNGGLSLEYVLKTYGLSKRFGSKLALDNVSINIKKGEIYGLIGKNGAGKTTLMRLALGLANPSGGSIELLDGQPLDDARHRIGALLESPCIYKNCTALENLRRFAILTGTPKEKLPELLRLVGLQNTGRKKAGKFSMGMKQRLGIAIALLGDPDFLILDEPINGLDPEGIRDVRDVILRLNRECGITFLISSHLLDELAKVVSTYGIISHGVLVEEISAAELAAHTSQRLIIRTSDDKKAAELIKSRYPDIGDITVDGSGVCLGSRIGNSAVINRTLNESGIFVGELIPSSRGLEDYFIERMGN